jgi:predicted ArsR family transcriptional regulator
MEQNKELSKLILTESLVTACSALTMTLDLQSANKAVRPHMENSGRAMVINLRPFIEEGNGMEKLTGLACIGFHTTCTERIEAFASEERWTAVTEGCPFSERAPVLCYAICHVAGEAFANGVKPGFIEHTVTPSNHSTRYKCLFDFKWQPDGQKSQELHRLDTKQVLNRVGEDGLLELRYAILAELWNIVIKAI